MPRPSTITHHPRRQEIETALARNEPLRRISARFDVSVTALHRHRHAFATGGTTSAIPSQKVSASPSITSVPKTSPTPDPFDILDAHYPWAAGEIPQPDPLAQQLRYTQRQHGTAAVRDAALAVIAQHQSTGLSDTVLGRKMDVEPSLIAAWRVELEREQLARLSQDPRSQLAREWGVLEQREQAAMRKLANAEIGSKGYAAANSALNQVHRARRDLRKEAGIRLELPPSEDRDDARGLGKVVALHGTLAEIMVAAGIDPSSTCDEGITELGENLAEAWATIDGEAEDGRPEPIDDLARS